MKNKAVSGIMLILLLTSMSTLAFNIQPVRSDWPWTETIYIRADGSVDPPTTPISSADNTTYTLTDNIVADVPGATFVIVVERDSIVVDGTGYTVQGTGSGIGISLSNRSNVTIRNMEIEAFRTGIWLFESSLNSIYGNSVTNNDWRGILINAHVHESSNNRIYGNNITNNGKGIRLSSKSSNNRIYGNNITGNNYAGIVTYQSSNNRVYGNNMTNSEFGIQLHYSDYFSIYGNNITNNEYGIWLAHSPANSIYHNNFVNNTEQVYRVDLTNVWDDDYPSGGNYWSDYEEMYPEAEELDGSGIWSTPYLIDENNQDNYPLMSLWIDGENGDGSDNGDGDGDILITHPFWMQWWFWTIVAIVIVASAGVVYSFKKRKKPSALLPSIQD